MRQFSVTIVAIYITFMTGCAPMVVIDDDDVGQRDQALSSENCEEQCMDEFHECKNSDDRGGGPGASACAHEKNDCKDRC